ncbi:NUDIX hydrolase [Pseudoflavitalea sp. G-6-1-2]|uniref:NUDIX hydrolase n=1 Tax=Pseudoflavitalea sp. G-6-1-2 TaxID=2728841 RepID=UPI00146BDB0C|nr:NUDIX hydrolase [Pseudoflavitalea sp. G-6-1-2]NML23622.1 NUDIX hydrolase [Pseudoflavitalea sp. G-6-1-2]
MHITIYFNDKPLFLTDTITDEIAPYAHHDDAVFMDELSAPGVNSMIHEMNQEKIHAGIYFHDDIEQLKHAFWRKFILVQAAGGLVQNPDNHVLMMFRRGKWDLPKGKMDPGETPAQSALREVEEETGIKATLGEQLVTTYHTYNDSGHHILKETFWFRMNATAGQALVPQTEEQITELVWADAKALKEYMKNTFPSVKEVISKAGL